jgi:hypothetical protein
MLYSEVLPNVIETAQFWLKSGSNNRPYTCLSESVSDVALPVSCEVRNVPNKEVRERDAKCTFSASLNVFETFTLKGLNALCLIHCAYIFELAILKTKRNYDLNPRWTYLHKETTLHFFDRISEGTWLLTDEDVCDVSSEGCIDTKRHKSGCLVPRTQHEKGRGGPMPFICYWLH